MNKPMPKPLPPLENGGKKFVGGIIEALNYLAEETRKVGLGFSFHLINVACEGVKMEFREIKANATQPKPNDKK